MPLEYLLCSIEAETRTFRVGLARCVRTAELFEYLSHGHFVHTDSRINDAYGYGTFISTPIPREMLMLPRGVCLTVLSMTLRDWGQVPLFRPSVKDAS